MSKILYALTVVFCLAGTADAFPDSMSGESENMSLVGRWAEGPCSGLAVHGTTLVRGEGGELILTDYADPSAPVVTDRIGVPIHPRYMLIDGDILALRNENESEIVLLDLGRPGIPIVGTIDHASQVDAWAMDGRRLVLGLHDRATSENTLEIIDISTPSSPVVHESDLGMGFNGIAVSGDILIVGSQNDIHRYDISDPAAVVAAGSLTVPYSGMSFVGTRLYACGQNPSWDTELSIIDCSAPDDPELLGTTTWAGSGYRHFISVIGDLAYCSDDGGDLHIIDVQDPNALVDLGAYNGLSSLASAVIGDLAFASLDYGWGLDVIDVSVSAAPTLHEHLATGRPIYGLATAGERAYVYEHEDFIGILDISNPADPQRVGSIDTGGEVWGLEASGALLLVSNDVHALTVYDCSAPSAPVVKLAHGDGSYDGTISMVGSTAYLLGGAGILIADVSDPDAIDVSGPHPGGAYEVAFVANPGYGYGIGESPSYTGVLNAYTLSGLEAPQLIRSVDLQGLPESVAVGDGYLYACSSNSSPPGKALSGWAVEIFDLSDPAAPLLVGSLDVPYAAGSSTQAARPMMIADGFLYLSGSTDGVYVYDLADPAAPVEHGYYDTGDRGRSLARAGQFIAVADRYDGVYFLRNESLVSLEDTEDQPAPTALRLLARPNPFNPKTTIRFELPEPGHVELTVVDVKGRTVSSLLVGARPVGIHDVPWNGTNDQGTALGSGLYIVRLRTDVGDFTTSITLLR